MKPVPTYFVCFLKNPVDKNCFQFSPEVLSFVTQSFGELELGRGRKQAWRNIFKLSGSKLGYTMGVI